MDENQRIRAYFSYGKSKKTKSLIIKKSIKKMGTVRQQTGKQFFAFFDGKIIKKVSEENEYTKKFTTKKGIPFFAEPFNSISGKVSKIYIFDEAIKDSDKFIKKLCLELVDGKENFVFTPAFNSNEAGEIIKRLCGAVDLSEDVTIKCMKDEKGYNLVFIQQNEVTVKSPYTKENPLPAWKETMVSGEKVWDKTEYLDALEKLVQKIKDMVKLTTDSKAGNSTNLQTEQGAEATEESDLPF